MNNNFGVHFREHLFVQKILLSFCHKAARTPMGLCARQLAYDMAVAEKELLHYAISVRTT